MTVFYADDDPEDCEFFRDALKQIDAELKSVIVHDGRQALKYLNATNELPDYIFLDINMPLLDGKKCLVEIKANPKFSNVPVIMYSTSSDTREIQECYKLGAHDFLIKPDNFTVLCESLESIFNLSKSRRIM